MDEDSGFLTRDKLLGISKHKHFGFGIFVFLLFLLADLAFLNYKILKANSSEKSSAHENPT